MLTNLTPNLEEIERRKVIAKENNFEYIPQSDPQWIEETGIYQSSCPFNFPDDEFIEKLDGYSVDTLYDIEEYGVADNVEQIKQFYKEQIEDKKNKFVIAVTPVWQEKENKGKGGGWRWHKWGIYIGNLNPQYEYLDDEEFGHDFEYILCFNLYHVI